jgi:hypothetical protein
MLELDSNKAKTVDFEIQLSGIDSKQLEGSLKIMIDGIEHGFKAEISPTNVIVNIPALKNILLREFKEGEQFDAKLEAYGAGYHLNPWNGVFIVKNPVSMEATIKESVEVPKITAKIKSEVSGKAKSKLAETKKVIAEKELVKPKVDVVIKEKHVFDYMKKKGTTNKEIQNLILEQCKAKTKTDDMLEVLKSVVNFYKTNKSKVL